VQSLPTRRAFLKTAEIARVYEAKTKIKPTLFVSRPASGATVIQA
jgi:hypothetical protein